MLSYPMEARADCDDVLWLLIKEIKQLFRTTQCERSVYIGASVFVELIRVEFYCVDSFLAGNARRVKLSREV